MQKQKIFFSFFEKKCIFAKKFSVTNQNNNMTQIKNSDVSAKEWYKNKLEKEGYKILEGKHPVDIVAEKGGVKYYFELKSQNTNKNPYVGGGKSWSVEMRP